MEFPDQDQEPGTWTVLLPDKGEGRPSVNLND